MSGHGTVNMRAGDFELVVPTCPCCGSPVLAGADPRVLDAGELAYTAQLIADGTVTDRRVTA